MPNFMRYTVDDMSRIRVDGIRWSTPHKVLRACGCEIETQNLVCVQRIRDNQPTHIRPTYNAVIRDQYDQAWTSLKDQAGGIGNPLGPGVYCRRRLCPQISDVVHDRSA